MPVNLLPYRHATDFKRVSEFLIKYYQPGNLDGNWLEPAWDYMHSHPALDRNSLEKIGIWEADGEIAGAAHYESSLGEAFFELHPGFPELKPAMLEYAQQHLWCQDDHGGRFLQVYLPEGDQDFQVLAASRGFRRMEDCDRPMSAMQLTGHLPAARLPDGFQVISLADENDLSKIHRVLWRGFNHAGEPPEEGLVWREMMQSAARFRPDLNMVVVAPDGNYAAYAGTWYEAVNRYVYVEPVATDPHYRRLGLARAAVLAGLQRCQHLGATIAYVGSDLEFYHALGFVRIFNTACWSRRLS